MTTLIVTTGADPCAELVVRALDQRGQHVTVVDTRQFPIELPLSIDAVVHTADYIGDTALADVDAVWLRHFDEVSELPADMRPDLRAASRHQSRIALGVALDNLDARVVDPPRLMARAPDTLGQLRLARNLGFDTPRTVLTNDPEAVRHMAEQCGELVCKMVSQGVTVAGAAGDEPIYTRRVGEDDLADLDGLRLCPMVFQEHVPKARELRLTIVGRQVFTAAVDSSRSTDGADDWRRDPALAGAFRAAELPGEIEARVHAFMERVQLEFATMDIIVTPDDRHVFLEMNTISHFGFVERATGLPIAAAVADLLIGDAATRRARA